MKTQLSVALCLLIVGSRPHGECWEAPWFCHKHECPEYTVVKTYDTFEERLYEPSRWITKDIASSSNDDLRAGFWDLYNFFDGQNDEQRVIPTTRPGLVSVDESTGKMSVSFYITPDTVLPKPNDETIREENWQGSTIYVRVFGGLASESDAVEQRAKLTDDLKAAGKLFDDKRYVGAGYDSPWNLINRHNELWIFAA